MKKYYVKVSHKEASMSQYYSIELEDYFTREALCSILSNATKYRIKVYDKLHFEIFFKDICKDKSDKESIYDLTVPFFNLKDLVEHIKKIKLYKISKFPIYKEVKDVEVRPFKLSTCFKVADVSLNFNEDITFFNIVKVPDSIKDIKFEDDDLKEFLHCKQAVNGFYYMYGVWKFYRNRNFPVEWEARKVTIRKEIIDFKEERVEL